MRRLPRAAWRMAWAAWTLAMAGTAAGQDAGAARPARAPAIAPGEARPMPPAADRLLGLLASGAGPALPAAGHWLTPDEERAVWDAVGGGIATALPRTGPFAFSEVLDIPAPVRAAYARKPGPTVRVLLRIVAGGEPGEAVHAAGCIAGLAKGPAVGALYALYPADRLDADRGRWPTRRQQLLEVLPELVAEGDGKAGAKDSK